LPVTFLAIFFGRPLQPAEATSISAIGKSRYVTFDWRNAWFMALGKASGRKWLRNSGAPVRGDTSVFAGVRMDARARGVKRPLATQTKRRDAATN
jgi:hypothetical protein